MKRLLSILFLIIFLFNAFGYLAIYIGLRFQLRDTFEKKLDANEYSGSETMIAKIPLTLPYPVNFNGYERIDGEFECKGEIYHLIKQNLVNDTLYVVFIKSKKETKLDQSFIELVKNTTGEPLSKTTDKLIDFLAKQCIASTVKLQNSITGWTLKSLFLLTNQKIIQRSQLVASPPPKV